MRFPPPPSKYAVISETGGKAASLRRASSSSTKRRSSRTRSKISLAVSSAMANLHLTFVFETWGRESCRPGKTEEAPKILGSGGGNFVRRQVTHTRKGARHFRNVGRLVTLAAPGLRCKVRSVRFNQDLLEWQSFCNVAKVLRFRIG